MITLKKANFSLNEATVERLAAFSDKTMAPKSKIVDRAINEYIDEQEKK